MKKILTLLALTGILISAVPVLAAVEGDLNTGFINEVAQTPKAFRSGLGNAAGNTAVASTVIPLAVEVESIEMTGQNATVAFSVALWDTPGNATSATNTAQSKKIGDYYYRGATPYAPLVIPGFKTRGRLWLQQTDSGTNTPVARIRFRLGAGAVR